MCRVYCDGDGERGLALVAILFERGVREVDSMVQTVPVRLSVSFRFGIYVVVVEQIIDCRCLCCVSKERRPAGRMEGTEGTAV
jgi:hypothetical protein